MTDAKTATLTKEPPGTYLFSLGLAAVKPNVILKGKIVIKSLYKY